MEKLTGSRGRQSGVDSDGHVQYAALSPTLSTFPACYGFFLTVNGLVLGGGRNFPVLLGKGTKLSSFFWRGRK